VNKTSESGVANGRAKRLKFRTRAFRDEFNTTVWQIADGAGDFKTGGDSFSRVAKADALDAA